MSKDFYFVPDQVRINLNKVITKEFCISHPIVLYDLFSKHYRGQPILFTDHDAENLYESGFFDLLSRLQRIFSIPDSAITFQTVVRPLPQYQHVEPVFDNPAMFFRSAGKYCNDLTDFDATQAKFVGALAASRFSVMRWLTLYELDQAFPGDTYLTFRNSVDDVAQRIYGYQESYTAELAWTKAKQFDHHYGEINNLSQAFNGLGACSWYGKVWHRYSIEVILETDEFANSWFTEKTARCLAVGRPFVLLAGQNSLKNLRQQGYCTFGDVIDESYDTATTPTLRLQGTIKSLQKLYHDTNRSNLLEQMFKIAQQNQSIYLKNVQS